MKDYFVGKGYTVEYNKNAAMPRTAGNQRSRAYLIVGLRLDTEPDERHD